MPRHLPALLFFCLLAFPALANANMAKPWDDGDQIGEAKGPLETLHVTSEALHIDMTALTETDRDKRRVHISATYQIDNRAQAADVELFFIAPAIANGAVEINGQALQSKLTDQKIPPEWRSSYAPYHDEGTGVLFVAPFKAGANTIKVTYSAIPGVYHPSEWAHRIFEIDYILAPAAQWGSFKDLTITAEAPEGWTLSSSLGEASGAGLEATFASLPQGNLELKADPPQWRAGLAQIPFGLSAVLAVLAALFLGWKCGQWTQPHGMGRTVATVLGTSIGAGVLATVLTLAGGTLAQVIPDAQYLSRSWGYNIAMTFFIFGMVLLPLICAIATAAAFGVRRWRIIRQNAP